MIGGRNLRGPAESGEFGQLFGALPGVTLEDEDVVNAFGSEEIDLIFWNQQREIGPRFLDCRDGGCVESHRNIGSAPDDRAW